MTINTVAFETRAFNELTMEVVEAITSQDEATACDALGELEGMWMHTECVDLRSRIADFMGQHAAHGEFVRFSA